MPDLHLDWNFSRLTTNELLCDTSTLPNLTPNFGVMFIHGWRK